MTTDAAELVRIGCNAANVHLQCSYPSCGCKQIPDAIRAVIAGIPKGRQASPNALSKPTDAGIDGPASGALPASPEGPPIAWIATHTSGKQVLHFAVADGWRVEEVATGLSSSAIF